MPNFQFITQLHQPVNNTDGVKTEMIVIDGDQRRDSIDVETASYLQRLYLSSHQNIYLCNVGEKYFSHHFKAAFLKGTFTILGLEAVTKGALKIIIPCIPESVTMIGVERLSPKASAYLLQVLTRLLKQGRKIQILSGDQMDILLKQTFENLNTKAGTEMSAVKKRKTSTSQIIAATSVEPARTSAKKSSANAEKIAGLQQEVARLSDANKGLRNQLELANARVKQLEDLDPLAPYTPIFLPKMLSVNPFREQDLEGAPEEMRDAHKILSVGKDEAELKDVPSVYGRHSIFAEPDDSKALSAEDFLDTTFYCSM